MLSMKSAATSPHNNYNKKKAFSLVETVVTLAVFGILLAMLSQVLLLNIRVSRKISERSRIREELAEFVGLLQRDLRNASFVEVDVNPDDSKCGENVDLDGFGGENDNGCQMSHVQTFYWVDGSSTHCDSGRVCKVDANTGDLLFQTSDVLNIEEIDFDYAIFEGDDAKATIIVTLIANASNPTWDITDQVRQISVSTRNFD